MTSDEPIQPTPAIDRLLARAREDLDRVSASALATEAAAGALVVDIRPVEQRRRDGELDGALVVDRNVLESSLAAATLQELGLRHATDLVGGYQALLRPEPGG
jgi:rhodanese-related sulfurtransferase